MDQIQYKQDFNKFASRWHLYKFLGSILTGFDFAKSANLAPFCFADSEGNFHRCPTFVHFINTLNKDFGGTFDVKASRQIGQQIILIQSENPEILENIQSTIIPKVFADKVEDSKGTEETSKVDWNYVESLNEMETKVAKSLLEEYAKPFGIDLKKNKSLANMVADLKAHVGE